jgi:Tfp pilus assembly protein PilX
LPDPANPANSLPIQPRYIIEDMGAVGGSVTTGGGYPPPVSMHAYRITAVGFGRITSLLGNPASRVVLQSIITH